MEPFLIRARYINNIASARLDHLYLNARVRQTFRLLSRYQAPSKTVVSCNLDERIALFEMLSIYLYKVPELH